MLTWRSLVLLGVPLCVLGAACASRAPDVGVVEVEAKAAKLVKLACKDSVEAVYARPGDLPPLDPSRRGDVVRCAQGERLNADALRSSLREGAFVDVEVHNDVQVFRISYRTQRAVQGADVSSALVVLPVRNADEEDDDNGDARGRNASASPGGSTRARPVHPVDRVYKDDDDESKRAPLIVYGHGTVPYRQDCAYSRTNPATAFFLGEPDRELRTVLALAAQGSPVIMPDYAGFVAGSFPAGYMFAEDEAYSVLDATRAMQKLLDESTDRVALVGHSQGGHAVLAAQSYVKSYGMAGNLAGVVALAPFWAPARAFGIIVGASDIYNTTTLDGTYALDAAVEYFYTHGELIDGRGHGGDVLKFYIDDLIGRTGTQCVELPDASRFGTTGFDLFTLSFQPVATCALAGEQCDAEIARKWSERFIRDRPTLDARGAPVLVWHGKNDATVPVDIAGCGIEKLSADFAGQASALKVCGDTEADHETIETRNLKYVIQWIKARAQGGDEPSEGCGDPTQLGASCSVGNFD